MKATVYRIVNLLCTELFQAMDKKLQERQLEKHGPEFTSDNLLKLIQIHFGTMVNGPQKKTNGGMKEEKQEEDIPHLKKDNLIPLFIQHQAEQITTKAITNKQKTQLENSVVLSKASSNQKKKKNKQSISQPITKQPSINNESALVKIKQKQEMPCISNNENEDDPQIIRFRQQRKQYKSQQKIDTVKIQKEKQKNLLHKREKFKREHNGKQYTFGFDGNPVNYTINRNKINYYQMNINVENVDKKFRSNTQLSTGMEIKEIKTQNKKVLDSEKPSVTLLISEIPLFAETKKNGSQKKSVLPSNEISKYKMSQFKQQYGGKFTRLNQSVENSVVNSREVSQKADNDDDKNNILSQLRYHEKEKKNMTQAMTMILLKNKMELGPKKKSMFPKIGGKYSAIDKYSFN